MDENVAQDGLDVTIEDFNRFLDYGKPGSKFAYHRGFLTIDRDKVRLDSKAGAIVHQYIEPYHSLAQTVYRAYERGKVELTQKKLGKGLYLYFATRRSKQAARPKRVNKEVYA